MPGRMPLFFQISKTETPLIRHVKWNVGICLRFSLLWPKGTELAPSIDAELYPIWKSKNSRHYSGNLSPVARVDGDNALVLSSSLSRPTCVYLTSSPLQLWVWLKRFWAKCCDIDWRRHQDSHKCKWLFVNEQSCSIWKESYMTICIICMCIIYVWYIYEYSPFSINFFGYYL